MSHTVNVHVPSFSMNLPGLISQSGSLTVYNNGTSYHPEDTRIEINPSTVIAWAVSILSAEMKEVRERVPEVNWEKVQDMIDSKDTEMYGLGITYLQEYTKYTIRIIHHVKYQEIGALEQLIKEFAQANSTNITGKIR